MPFAPNVTPYRAFNLRINRTQGYAGAIKPHSRRAEGLRRFDILARVT